MKVYTAENDAGSVRARLLVEADELRGDEPAEAAIERAIRQYAEQAGLPPLVYVRVLEMEQREDGLSFGFEAAVPPRVTLGQYRDIRVSIGHDEDFDTLVLDAAAKNVAVEIPELLISRKLEELTRQRRAEVLDSASLNALADMYAIISGLRGEGGDDGELWRQALTAAASYTDGGEQTLEAFSKAIADAAGIEPYLVYPALDARIGVRRVMDAERIAGEVFTAYLHMLGQSEDEWRQEQRDAAAALCRVDLMLDAIVATERIEVEGDELEQSYLALSEQYRLPPEELKALVRPEALAYQLKLSKARQLIIDTASC